MSKLPVLPRSPHDVEAARVAGESTGPAAEEWVPSRYNVRAIAEDGRLVLWNTLSGKLTVFKPENRETVLALLRRKGFEAPRGKSVAYLAERGYLVRRGVDEYRQFQQLFGEEHYRTDVLELILLASEDCNFRCTYCYEEFARGTMRPEVREGVKKLVRRRVRKLNRLHVSWFGGEPLYGWEAVEDLAPFFAEIAAENDLPLSASMTTNGYLLTSEVADRLFAWGIRHFQITLDGLPEYHDCARVTRDGKPTFEQILANLKDLSRREEPFDVLLRVNFDQANAGSLREFADLLAEEFRGDPRFHLAFRAVGKFGGPNDAQLDLCGREEASRIEREILEYAGRRGLYFGSLREVSHLGGQVCYAARPYSFLIGATGKVMKCTIVLDRDDYNVVGHLTPAGDLVIDRDRMALWTEPAFERDGQCQKCVVLPNCQGIHCPMIRIEEDTQPCVTTRSHLKAEMLTTLDAPSRRDPGLATEIRREQDDQATVSSERSTIRSRKPALASS